MYKGDNTTLPSPLPLAPPQPSGGAPIHFLAKVTRIGSPSPGPSLWLFSPSLAAFELVSST